MIFRGKVGPTPFTATNSSVQVKSNEVSGTRTASVQTLGPYSNVVPPRVVGYDGDPGVTPWEELVESKWRHGYAAVTGNKAALFFWARSTMIDRVKKCQNDDSMRT